MDPSAGKPGCDLQSGVSAVWGTIDASFGRRWFQSRRALREPHVWRVTAGRRKRVLAENRIVGDGRSDIVSVVNVNKGGRSAP